MTSPEEFFEAFEKENPEHAEAWAEAVPARVFAGALRHFRMSRGLTQGELAEAMGITQSAVSRLENASHTPGFDTVMRAFMALKVEMHLGFDEHECVLLPEAVLDSRLKAAFEAGRAQGLTEAADLQRRNASSVREDDVENLLRYEVSRWPLVVDDELSPA